MRHVAILGFGREGRALLRYLRRKNQSDEIVVLDRKLDPDYLKGLEKFDLIYRSPGIPYNRPEIQRAVKNGVKLSSATALFFERAKGEIIGVTGTKGKGTTSTLIYKILKNAGRDAYLVGNIGKPAITILNRPKNNSITVLELSSFQLQDLKRSPHIAAVLGLFPDHMDAHKNFKEYFKAKANITRFQNKKDKVFYTAGNGHAEAIAKRSRGTTVKVDTRGIDPSSLKIAGPHNLKNAAMAAAVARSLGVPEKIISKTLRNYRGLPYRLQYLTTIKGARIYNDSASTNPMTTAAAIRAFTEEPKVLIMGGRDKNLNYAPVAKALCKSNVKLVVLYGECRGKIRGSIKGTAPIRMIAGNLEVVFKTALAAAKPGSVIIFSPGATSFDMFKDYTDRGRKFTAIAKRTARRYTRRG